MTKYRHLTWMLIAAVGFVFSASQSHAQKRPDADEPGLVADDSYELDPQFRKQVVYYRSSEAPGTIVVVTAERHLVPGAGQRPRHPLRHRCRPRRLYVAGPGEHHPQGGVAGLDAAAGNDPRQPYLPRFMAGGPGNPLGARAMYLGTTVYRIHGTNRPDTIGTAVSSGCFRLVNRDVADLYERVPVGTKVIIRQKPEL